MSEKTIISIKENLAWITVLFLSSLPVFLWLFSKPANMGFTNFPMVLISLGQIAGLAGITMFSLVMILNARLKFLDTYMAGMDQLLHMRFLLSITAFLLFLAHPLFLAFSKAFTSFNDAARFFLYDAQWETNFGIFALLFLMTLALLTFLNTDPSKHRKFRHQLLGMAFFFGSAHTLMMLDTAPGLALKIYVFVFISLGFLSYIYRMFLAKLNLIRYEYCVIATNMKKEGMTEIELIPKDFPIDHLPGQFMYATFDAKGFNPEAYPFSITSSPLGRELSFIVPSDGNTAPCMDNIRVDDSVMIDGPFGRFSYRNAHSKKQIWIAYGYGVAPFLGMARDLLLTSKMYPEYNVDLFYCMEKSGESDVFTELSEIAKRVNGFRAFSFDENVLPTGEEISKLSNGVADKDIFIRGPRHITHPLKKQLLALSAPRHSMHTEEFPSLPHRAKRTIVISLIIFWALVIGIAGAGMILKEKSLYSFFSFQNSRIELENQYKKIIEMRIPEAAVTTIKTSKKGASMEIMYENGLYEITLDTKGNIMDVQERERGSGITAVTKPALSIGNTVQTRAPLDVRSAPGYEGAIIGTQKKEAQGIIADGPTFFGGRWVWDVDYIDGSDGWSPQDLLEIKEIVSPQPLKTPSPAQVTPSSISTPSPLPTHIPTPPPDTKPPDVSIVHPANNATIEDIISLNASASDESGIESVVFTIDGAYIATKTAAPYSVPLNTKRYSNGAHILEVTAKDRAGNSKKISASIIIHNAIIPPQNKPPVVQFFKADVLSGEAPLTVQFNNSVSDPDKNILNCKINFGEGAGFIESVCNSAVPHIYAASGSYSVRFQVTDKKQTVEAPPLDIRVTQSPSPSPSPPPNNPPIVHYFEANISSGNTPLTVGFSMSASDPDLDALTCGLDFGDGYGYGKIDCSGYASYTYGAAGVYMVRFRVFDGEFYANAPSPIEITVNQETAP